MATGRTNAYNQLLGIYLIASVLSAVALGGMAVMAQRPLWVAGVIAGEGVAAAWMIRVIRRHDPKVFYRVVIQSGVILGVVLLGAVVLTTSKSVSGKAGEEAIAMSALGLLPQLLLLAVAHSTRLATDDEVAMQLSPASLQDAVLLALGVALHGGSGASPKKMQEAGAALMEWNPHFHSSQLERDDIRLACANVDAFLARIKPTLNQRLVHDQRRWIWDRALDIASADGPLDNAADAYLRRLWDTLALRVNVPDPHLEPFGGPPAQN
ncbi:MAG: hypothetical protein DCC64_10825 [Planctomycetota bacterium]|nr:MAG: hypothetical protein DCC64_10825 [Planctomycetota bacterium]